MNKTVFSSRKAIWIYCIVGVLLIMGIAAAILLPKWLTNDQAPIFSSHKAPDDFTDTFAMADREGADIVAVTVDKIETVDDVIEYYEVYESKYTKLTCSTVRDFTEYTEDRKITVYIMGTNENFPHREVFVKGRTYLFTLTPWAHQDGLIYLLNPLQSTFIRIHNNELIVRKDAGNAYYMMTNVSPDEFAKKLAEYRTENPLDPTVRAAHFKAMAEKMSTYDYDHKDLAFTLPQKHRTARKTLADTLAE